MLHVFWYQQQDLPDDIRETAHITNNPEIKQLSCKGKHLPKEKKEATQAQPLFPQFITTKPIH
jgi:hypothetical protein